LPGELDARDLELLNAVADTRSRIHGYICDDFDTPNIMRALEHLVNAANAYMRATDVTVQSQVLTSTVRLVREVLANVGIGPSPGFDKHCEAYDIPAGQGATRGEGGRDTAPTHEAMAGLIVDFRHKVRD
jgi:hypothetical protein